MIFSKTIDIVFYQLDCVLSNKSILCDKEFFQIILTILEEQRLVYISDEELGLRTLEIWSDVGNFHTGV